jgi:hypothetical protein
LRLGLPIVAFDMDANNGERLLDHPGDMQLRERRMAEHIAERVLHPEPAARVLIWVGHQHGQKIERGLKMMAMHLWEITAEEPVLRISDDWCRQRRDTTLRHACGYRPGR